MKMTSTFKTAKGANIELITENITSEIINADGHEIEVKADGIKIKEVKVNGESHRGTLTSYQGMKVINYGYQGRNPLLIAIPADVYEAVWGEYDKRIAARLAAAAEADRKYEAHYNRVMKAMEE